MQISLIQARHPSSVVLVGTLATQLGGLLEGGLLGRIHPLAMGEDARGSDQDSKGDAQGSMVSHQLWALRVNSRSN